MNPLKLAALLLAALTAYLCFWPTGVAPVGWTPPAAPGLEGVYAYNESLKGIQRLAEGVGIGPEGIAVDSKGRLYGGYADGRVVILTANGGSYTELADTGGRPLGITVGARGDLLIADARKGLLQLGDSLTPLVQEAGGVALGFTDDAVAARQGDKVYFTDATWKFGYGDEMKDFLEHGANGRLLEYDVASRQARVLMKDLHFANGVATGPDDAYVLVNETAEYRILRYWLKGQHAGTWDVFIDNLPGFPDNVSFNGRDTFWVALYAPRFELLDGLLPGSFLMRRVSARLPSLLQPKPSRQHAFVLGLGLDGRVAHNLQYRGDDAYAPITSVREHGPWLYFGSLKQSAIGRLPLHYIVPGARVPLPGTERIPKPVEQARRGTRTAQDDEGEESRGSGVRLRENPGHEEKEREDSSENRRYP